MAVEKEDIFNIWPVFKDLFWEITFIELYNLQQNFQCVEGIHYVFTYSSFLDFVSIF